MTEKYVLYKRVSSKQQGDSGLGLAAQESMMMAYLANKAILQVFTEVETGSDNERPVLAEAIKYCKENGAILVVAKLDRLGRDMEYLSSIRKQVQILDIENPSGNNLVFGIKGVLAEEERVMISDRTRKALRAKIAIEGKYVNNPKGVGLEEARKRSAYCKKEAAKNNDNNKRAIYAIYLLMRILKDDFRWEKAAEQLNEFGFKSSTNKVFTGQSANQLWGRRYNYDFYYKLNII